VHDESPCPGADGLPREKRLVFRTILRRHNPPRWAAELGMRIRRNAVLSIVGTTVFNALFFVGYLYIQQHPLRMPMTIPAISIDRLISYQPQLLPAYVSLWIYVGAGPGLQRSYCEVAAYTLWMAALCVTGLGIFYFWPTQVPPLSHGAATSFGLSLLHRLDETGNACPSMHVATATFTLVRLDEVFRSTQAPLFLRLVNSAWFVVIAYSTLAIKQHMAIDVAAGALLGLMFVLPSLRWRPKPRAVPGVSAPRGGTERSTSAVMTTESAP
jgi:membrane-associated phospholipid phosphatase